MRRSITVLFFLLPFLLLGCGGPPPSSEGSATSGEMPEITEELIYERINDAWVRDVPPEVAENKEPIFWNFDHDEPKEVTIVDKKQDGTRATIVLDIKTGSAPRARVNRQLAGQIRTEWELKTGFVLRRWEIVDVENISMKYKDIPKPLEQQNSNR